MSGVRGAGATLPLTDRQRQVVRLTWEGLTDKEIARRLCAATQTVRNTLWAAYRRLGVAGCGCPRAAAAVALWREEFGGRGATGEGG